ncbi:MAG: hypothetical protein AAF805_03500 [Planctomycetota bacterium]
MRHAIPIVAASVVRVALPILMAAPCVSAEWVVRATESFDDPDAFAARWEVLDPATWRIGDDPLRGGIARVHERESAYRPPHKSPKHVAVLRDEPVGDFRLTFEARSPRDSGPHRDCCVIFGWQHAARFYYVHLGAVPDDRSGQIMIVDNADRTALTENTNRVPWTDDWSTVRVERRLGDGAIRVYFDDLETPVMEVADTTLGDGLVGLGSFDDLIDFDNLRLETASGDR